MTIRDMKDKRNKTTRRGAALLIVLFIVMAVTILSLGFLSRSDVALACGENMILRAQMDYLAESGLEHARGLIVNPQDVSSEYWTGAVGQQLVTGSDDYYDVSVVKLGACNYQISSSAYRKKTGEKIGQSNLRAELRLDPCIAYWAGSGTTISQGVVISGDVYCKGVLTNNGLIDGDVFANGLNGNIRGQQKATGELSLAWPGLAAADFSSHYYIGSFSYSVRNIDPNVFDTHFGPDGGNPGGVCYCNGDLSLKGGVIINGTLVVNGNLRVSGTGNTIVAVRNFPALLVSGEVVMENGGTLMVEGLAQIGQRIAVSGGAENVDVKVSGGLFIENGGIDGVISDTVSVDITASPSAASIQTWTGTGTARRWGPAAGAFFKSIERE
jgi:hypothetical protein